MYESQSYAVILQRLLEKVPDDLDKRSGSVIYDALAPAAIELSNAYVALDSILTSAFADSANDEYLEYRTNEFGITRKSATAAIRKGLFYGTGNNSIDVPIGSRFSINGVSYTVILKLAAGQFELQSETKGVVGNQNFGTLLPLDYINGLVSATLTDVLIPGEDIETDDKLRARFLQQVRLPSTSGNKADYKKWALEVDGVGKVEVFPQGLGPGTVKIAIVDALNNPASSELVQSVQNYISPTDGMGEGTAPIGAKVTVVSAIGKTISITVDVTLAVGYTIQDVQNKFTEAIVEYFREIAFSVSYVSFAKSGTILLSVPGVFDYTNLRLNGSLANVSLLQEEVPILGGVDIGVSG
ncbi:baseplate J/gp47 family protein [Paenibacillus sp. 2RAB27]|uniref:baseplate J/gp47 family protein n=1 Tax=Paenibacillus sp. 2RAB27 TaxID=3232991 RepID=UPI003F98F3A2